MSIRGRVGNREREFCRKELKLYRVTNSIGTRLHVYVLHNGSHNKSPGVAQTEVQAGSRYHEFTQIVVGSDDSQPVVQIVPTVSHKAECKVIARPGVYLESRKRSVGLCRVFAVGYYLAAAVEYQYAQAVQPILHSGIDSAGVGRGAGIARTDCAVHIGQQHSQTDTCSNAFFHTCSIELIAHTPRKEQCTEKIQNYYLFHLNQLLFLILSGCYIII